MNDKKKKILLVSALIFLINIVKIRAMKYSGNCQLKIRYDKSKIFFTDVET